MAERKLLTRTEVRAIAPLAASVAFRMFGLFLLLPVIAPHVVAHPDGTLALAGLAVGIYGLAQACMLAPLGWLSDTLGRKPVLLGGLALFAVGGFLGGAIEHPIALIVGRLVQGLGAVSAVALAAIADVTTSRNRAQGMALVGAGIALAFGLSLVLAGPLVTALGVPGMMFLTGWLGLFSMAVIAVTKFEKPSADTGLHASMVDVRVLPLCGGVFGLHCAMAAMFVVLPLRLAELLSVDRLWQVYLVSFGLALVLAAPMIVRRSTKSVWFWVAVGLVAVPILALPFAGKAGLLVLGFMLTLFFAGFCYLEAVLPARASSLAAPGGRGATMGVYSIAQALGVFTGGVIAGWLAMWL